LAERAAQFIFCAARDDLDDVPYTLHMTELPEPFAGLPVGGWAGPADDLRFRDQIEALIGWRGRGPLIVLSGDSWPTVAAIAVHEAAHVLESDWTFDESESRALAPPEACVAYAHAATNTTSDRSRRDHGLRFHRSLSHLVARIAFDPENWGFDDRIGCGADYGFAQWSEIRRTFSAEVWERRYEPIRRILESDPPPEAARLFCE
jgi:hypothetical protein